ncbi:hypothetical protein B0H14DRAFT_2652438 [Mycena olivaceomarginata]|nr:hypothetical protein B0H14DRAFT_2652438 [Mycena olivaceomarginata]
MIPVLAPLRSLPRAHFSALCPRTGRSVSPGSIDIEHFSLAINAPCSSEEVESEDATGSDFDPDQKTSSPDSDEEFPSSLPLPTAEAPMDVDEEPESSHRARRPASASRGKSSPTKAASKTVVRAQSPDESRAERSPMPDDSVELNLAEHRLPSWALPAHFPKFKIRSDPSNPVHRSTSPSVMETFKDPRQVKSRLEDSHPSVFDNPVQDFGYGKWLEHIAHGDTSVGRYCRISTTCGFASWSSFLGSPQRLILPDSGRPQPSDIHSFRAKTGAAHIRVSSARSSGPSGGDVVVSGVPEDLQPECGDSGAARGGRNGAVRAARHGLPSRPREVGSDGHRHRRDVPIIRAEQVEVLRLYRACREDIIDRMEREANTVGEYAYHVASRALSRPANARVRCRVLPSSSSSVPNPSIPSKRGHEEIDDVPTPPIAAFTSAQSDSDEERSASVTRVGPPGKGKTRDVERGSFLGAGSAAGPSTTDEGTSFAVGGPSSSQQGGAFDIDAWHEAHNPFNQPPFQQDLVLNANGTKAVVSHGWQLDPVNPRFLLALAPYGVLGVYRLQGQERLCSPRLVGRAARHELPAVPRENRTCVASTSGFDFTLTVHRQNARLREGRAPRADPPNVEVPLERRVDVLVRPGAGRQEFLESFVPFQGAQYGDRRHRLPLPDRQSPIDATTYLTHMLEDVTRMGGSFGQRISQAFLPERRVVVPEDFEVGDRPLDFGGFLAAGEVRSAAPTDPASDAELSEFPSTYHFGSEARARFEQEYQGSVAHRHADGRVTGPLVAEVSIPRRKTPLTRTTPLVRMTPLARRPLGPVRRVRGSLPPIEGIARHDAPSTSAAFTSVPATPSNSSQTSFASVGSADLRRPSIRYRVVRYDAYPASQWVRPRWFVGPAHFRVGNDASHSVVGEKSHLPRDFAPPQIVTNPQVLPPPSPVRAASVARWTRCLSMSLRRARRAA